MTPLRIVSSGKQIFAKIARRLGFVVIPARRNMIVVPPSEEHFFHVTRYLRRLFDLLKIDCVIDVGANLGQYRRFLRERVGYPGVVVSFEPILEHVNALKREAESDRNYYVEHCALGS